MIPPVGTTCLFSFATPFAALNGVYTIVKTMSFETALASGVDFVATLYTPAGRTAANYTSEYATYAGQLVLQIQGVGNSAATIYYVPLGVLSQVPDPTVERYADVYLSIHIGAFTDETVYTWIAGQINDIVAAVTGNTDTAQFYSNPSDDLYLTQGQYAALVAARALNITTVNPLLVQNQALQAMIDKLQTLITAYQNTMIALYTTNAIIQATQANATATLGSLSASASISN